MGIFFFYSDWLLKKTQCIQYIAENKFKNTANFFSLFQTSSCMKPALNEKSKIANMPSSEEGPSHKVPKQMAKSKRIDNNCHIFDLVHTY